MVFSLFFFWKRIAKRAGPIFSTAAAPCMLILQASSNLVIFRSKVNAPKRRSQTCFLISYDLGSFWKHLKTVRIHVKFWRALCTKDGTYCSVSKKHALPVKLHWSYMPTASVATHYSLGLVALLAPLLGLGLHLALEPPPLPRWLPPPPPPGRDGAPLTRPTPRGTRLPDKGMVGKTKWCYK